MCDFSDQEIRTNDFPQFKGDHGRICHCHACSAHDDHVKCQCCRQCCSAFHRKNFARRIGPEIWMGLPPDSNNKHLVAHG